MLLALRPCIPIVTVSHTLLRSTVILAALVRRIGYELCLPLVHGRRIVQTFVRHNEPFNVCASLGARCIDLTSAGAFTHGDWTAGRVEGQGNDTNASAV